MTLTQGETDEEGNVKLRKLGNFGGGGKYVVAALLAVLLSAHFSFADTPTFNIGASDNNTSVVNFGGQQWWAIGQNTETNTVRLLLKSDSTSTGYEKSAFRSYNNGYDGTVSQPNGKPNEYADSTLQRTIQGIANALPVKEQAVIQARTSADLQNGVGNTPLGSTTPTWVDLAAQKLWALSYDEWSAVKGDATIFTGKSDYGARYFWLRSPNPDLDDYSLHGVSGGGTYSDSVYSYSLGVRPAFDLDLTNVAGYATLDSGYKFTFYDNSIAAPEVSVNADGTLGFAGSLLASLTYGGTTGDLFALTATDGVFDLALLGALDDGDYTLNLYNAELSGDDLSSDFVGQAFQYDFTVGGSTATPEPATMLIFGVGVSGAVLTRLYRRKRK